MPRTNVFSRLADAFRGARADVDALRDRRLVILEKADAIRNAPVTEAEIAERVDAILDAAERNAREWANLGGLASADGGSVDIGAAVRHEPLGLLAMFDRDGVRTRLIAEATATVTGKSISRDEREAALAKFAGELHDLERAEEQAVRDAEAAGATIHRRPDADPAVFLAETLE